MKVSIKTPFADMSLEMSQYSAMQLLQQAMESAYKIPPKETTAKSESAPAGGEEPEKENAEKPAPKSRVESMFGSKETWNTPEESGQDKPNEGKQTYKGFLLIRCEKCGRVKAYCAKYPTSAHRCECGHSTELEDLIPVYAVCKCGGEFKYRTNIRDPQITIDCLKCSAPIDLELNKRETAYVTIGREMRGGGIDNHYPSYVGRDAGRMKF